MNGDFDLRTDVYQAREVAANFPNATYVEVPNYGHVTSVYEVDRCPSVIVRRFVTTLDAGDTSCTGRISEHRVVPVFARKAAGIPQATVASPYDRSSANDRRAATVAVQAIADVIDRWYAIPGYSGTSLYGGRFHMTNTSGLPVSSQIWTLKLHRLRWTRDIAVSGTGSVPRGAGLASMSVTIKGGGDRPRDAHDHLVDPCAACRGEHRGDDRRTPRRPGSAGSVVHMMRPAPFDHRAVTSHHG